jgi:hypothetical protein
MIKYNNLSRHNNEWHVPPGRYLATLTQITARSDDARLIFTIHEQRGLTDVKKAGKSYSSKRSHWIENDLRSWLGRDGLQKLAADGVLGLEQLNQLIGTKAVLVITNEDHGQDAPLTVISEILPYTHGNLKGLSASGPRFRLSFAPDEDDSAMAA